MGGMLVSLKFHLKMVSIFFKLRSENIISEECKK